MLVLSIGDFSEMCHLSTQAMRFYHAEGLLVPTEVDERTGYRSYTFDQIERAMLITVLRSTGMSVRQVRGALDDPDSLPSLLDEHAAATARRRRVEDEALRDAYEFARSWPEVCEQRAVATTVLSAVVPAVPVEEHEAPPAHYPWDLVDDATTAIVDMLRGVAGTRGIRVVGTPWRAPAIETPEQKRANLTVRGPHWLVKLPVDAEAGSVMGLPDGVEVQVFDARDELAILLPGRSSRAKFGTALARLTTHPLTGAFVDIGRMRHVLQTDGVVTAAAIVRVEEEPAR